MSLKVRIGKIRRGCIKIYLISVPYFFVMFLSTYALLALLRYFCGPGLFFLLSVSIVGFDLWDEKGTLQENLIDMVGITITTWLLFMGLSFIICLPIIENGIMLLLSLAGAGTAIVSYNREKWEDEQLRYLM